ncbi:MAG TPA: hypothetical protein VMU40_03485 [Steroidobacteraceae bacterium]|nr:hypothetical protein [Steroidobacteraceae bacterium]
MSRISVPANVDAAPEAARASLQAVGGSLSVVPSLFRLVALSPAALKGYLGIGSALSGAVLDAKTQERLAPSMTSEPIRPCASQRAW